MGFLDAPSQMRVSAFYMPVMLIIYNKLIWKSDATYQFSSALFFENFRLGQGDRSNKKELVYCVKCQPQSSSPRKLFASVGTVRFWWISVSDGKLTRPLLSSCSMLSGMSNTLIITCKRISCGTFFALIMKILFNLIMKIFSTLRDVNVCGCGENRHRLRGRNP